MEPAVDIFPTVSLAEAFHIGSLKVEDQSVSMNMGRGLYICAEPKDWLSIYYFSDPSVWRMQKHGNRFLDFNSLGEEAWEIIEDWGRKNGYIREEEMWRFSSLDDDGNHLKWLYFWSPEEAEFELMIDPESPDLERVTITAPSDKLLKYHGAQHVSDKPNFIRDWLAIAYSEQLLDLDGVWWQDAYDKERNQAPKGVIFRAKIQEWSAEHVPEMSRNIITWPS